MPPFFSIIIPVYNVAPYLRECLDSVLAQTFIDWEAICVDDGSTDGSGAILDEYAARDKRFRVIHKQNEGVGVARNYALDVAKGKWICFLDGDDVWHKEFLATFLSAISKYPGERCFRVGYNRFSGGELIGWSSPEGISFRKIDISRSIEMRDFFFFFFCCYVYRRDLFDGIRFPRYIRGEDRWVINKMQLERLDSIVAADARLYGYRQRKGSAMSTAPSLQVLCDEMDHRLDIMEMIDRSAKVVAYAGDWWLEEYFTKSLPMMFTAQSNICKVKREWRNRLSRLRKCRGLSKTGKFLMWLYSSRVLSPIGDFIVFGRVGLRHCISKISYIVRFCRGMVR